MMARRTHRYYTKVEVHLCTPTAEKNTFFVRLCVSHYDKDPYIIRRCFHLFLSGSVT